MTGVNSSVSFRSIPFPPFSPYLAVAASSHGIRCGLDSLEIHAIRVQTDLGSPRGEALGAWGGRQRKLRSRCESLKRLLSSDRLQCT